MKTVGVRRKAREVALMILYQIDVVGTEPDTALRRFFDSFDSAEPLDPPPLFLKDSGERDDRVPPEAREYASVIVRGVCGHLHAIDEKIQKVSTHWRLERMAWVDRNILRIGTFELAFLPGEVPRKVAINEAVEVAKKFSTAESGAFINGILDRVEP